MINLLKYRSSVVGRRWISLLICLVFFGAVYGSFAWLVYAEGSRTLYPSTATGSRASLVWHNSFYGNNFLRRRALFKVYAQAGEVLVMGSSAIGVDNGEIRVYDPGSITGLVGDENIPATPAFSCNAQRVSTGNPDQGRITSRAQELAGADTITDATTAARGNVVPTGYVPCFYPAPQTGIYYVTFWGPAGDGSTVQINPVGSIPDNPNNFNNQQGTTVSTWDITVRDSLTSVNDRTGRVFANYLAMFTGANPRPINSTLYILTTDGYIYQTDLRGVDPNGFIIYANGTGFLNSDGTPLYHDVVASPNGTTTMQQDQLEVLQGNVSMAPPTHFIFLQPPSAEAIAAAGVPSSPVAPQVDSLVFDGDLGGNNTTLNIGGTFVYTSNISGTYELIISRDGVNFDPTNPLNRVLRGTRPAGAQNVVWDGHDNAGNPFPVGLNYPISITMRAGEYHFPLLDVENSLGGPQYTLLNPPGGCPSFYGGVPNCHIAFYDDRNYTSTSNIFVDTSAGSGPPVPIRSDPLAGFDTTTNQRAFGTGTNAGFGDKKGLDLWTYFPSQPKGATLNIFSFNLQLAKTDGGISTVPGGTVVYTLTYTNTGPADATGVVITETVPANTTFASTPGWTCVGVTCVFPVGAVNGGTSGAVNFAVTVDNPLPAGITQIANSAVIGDDGTHGPEPSGDNTATETTPLNILTFNLQLAKTDGGISTVPGGTVVYTLTYTNTGPADATGVVITETVPANTTFASTPGWTCVGVTCVFPVGAVNGGTSGAVNFAVTVDNPLPAGITQIANSAVIGDDGTHGPEPSGDNTATETTPLNILTFNLQLAKTDGGISTVPGGTVVYTLTYTNTGPADATGVVITETVPANTTFASTPGWTCVGVTCVFPVGAVNGGTSGAVNFAVTVDNPLPAGITEIANSAVIGDDGTHGPEPSGDNTATETTPLNLAIVDPRITKVANLSEARPGDVVDFSIVVFNPAPPSNAPATHVILTEPLPLALDLINFNLVDPWGLTLGPPIVTSNIVSLVGHPSGVTQTVASTITVNIPVLGVSQAVTLNVTAQVNNLASPPPVSVINEATLSFDQGAPRRASVPINVPTPAPAPNPGGNGGKDKDDDHKKHSSSAAVPPAAPPVVTPAPPPVLPVLYLPETGIGPVETNSDSLGWGMLMLPSISLIGFVVFYTRWRRKR